MRYNEDIGRSFARVVVHMPASWSLHTHTHTHTTYDVIAKPMCVVLQRFAHTDSLPTHVQSQVGAAHATKQHQPAPPKLNKNKQTHAIRNEPHRNRWKQRCVQAVCRSLYLNKTHAIRNEPHRKRWKQRCVQVVCRSLYFQIKHTLYATSLTESDGSTVAYKLCVSITVELTDATALDVHHVPPAAW